MFAGAPADAPAAMRLIYWFALMLSAVLGAAFVLTAAGVLAPTIAGQAVTREAWWRVGPILLVVSAFAAAIAWGIRRSRPWSRHLVMVVWLTLAGAAFGSWRRGDIPTSVLARALVEPAVLILLCGWYFYGKRNVVEYFRAIGRGWKPPAETRPISSGEKP
jgi:hypothetical protein